MQQKIEAALSSVKYPGFSKDIVTLGMVEEYTVDGGDISIKMKPSSAGDDVKNKIAEEIVATLAGLGLKAQVLFGDTQAGGHEHTQPGKQLPPKQEIKGIKHILPVASGKGGVGKSTTSVNLAVALSKQGYAVGILDLDVYGPSLPTMMGLEGMHDVTSDNRLSPTEKYGIKVISMGMLMEKGAPLIWRGPMVMKVVKQLLYDVEWGNLDYLVLDLPPGTGDVQLTLIQSIPISGAVVVTTPQDVALADATKAFNMFVKTDTKVLGIIENMSRFICPHCKGESHIFGSGGGRRESDLLGVPFLGEIPLEGNITATGDKGEPVALGDDATAQVFAEIAKKLAKALEGNG